VKLLAVVLFGFQFAAPLQIADGFDPSTAGLAAVDVDGGGKPEIVAWSANGVKVFRYGSKTPVDCGLGGVRDVISISPGDFNNDGRQDLAILTKFDAELWVNRKGRFEKLNILIPEGAYNKPVWVDYDHDGALDLFLLGDKSVLLRNDGAGFTNVSNNFPFVQGRAVDGAIRGGDLVVLYSDRPGVRYIDKTGGRYEAEELTAIPTGMRPIGTGAALELDYYVDGRADRFEIGPDGWLVFLRGTGDR
jgi:hypothetical protein